MPPIPTASRPPTRPYGDGLLLVPIVVGYAIAHYATLLIVEGQRVAVNLSDPLGLGWNVFGTADLTVSTAVFSHPTGGRPAPARSPSSAVTCSASSTLTRRPSRLLAPRRAGRAVADAGGDGRLHVRRVWCCCSHRDAPPIRRIVHTLRSYRPIERLHGAHERAKCRPRARHHARAELSGAAVLPARPVDRAGDQHRGARLRATDWRTSCR